MAGGLSFLGRDAGDTSLSPEMQAWLDQRQPDYLPAAVAPGSSSYNPPSAPAAADPDKVLTPLGRKWAGDLTNIVTAPQRAYTGELQVWDPATGHTTQEAQDAAMGMAGVAMTGGFGGVGPGGVSLGAGPIRAYHGSPHDFDRFDISKLGTGEGAQAYGHGLYFAGNEGVARSYRDVLSRDGFKAADGSVFDPSTLEHMNVRTAARRNGPDLDATISRANDLLPTMPPDAADMLRRDIQRLSSLKAQGGISTNPGHMYEVGIDADPAKLLNWDAPVTLQPKVRDLAGDMGARLRSDATGADAYRAISDRSPIPGSDMGGLIEPDFGSPAVAAQRLREAGVPGIKYLDGGSRIAGDGSHNYVTFSDDIVSILRKYGLAGVMGGGAAAAVMGQPSDAQAAEPLPFLGRR